MSHTLASVHSTACTRAHEHAWGILRLSFSIQSGGRWREAGARSPRQRSSAACHAPAVKDAGYGRLDRFRPRTLRLPKRASLCRMCSGGVSKCCRTLKTTLQKKKKGSKCLCCSEKNDSVKSLRWKEDISIRLIAGCVVTDAELDCSATSSYLISGRCGKESKPKAASGREGGSVSS